MCFIWIHASHWASVTVCRVMRRKSKKWNSLQRRLDVQNFRLDSRMAHAIKGHQTIRRFHGTWLKYLSKSVALAGSSNWNLMGNPKMFNWIPVGKETSSNPRWIGSWFLQATSKCRAQAAVTFSLLVLTPGQIAATDPSRLETSMSTTSRPSGASILGPTKPPFFWCII